MLSPKRVKYRKKQRGKMDGVARRGNTVAFGDFGLVALEPRWITNRQVEKFGFEFFLTCRLQRNLLKQGRGKVRVILKVG